MLSQGGGSDVSPDESDESDPEHEDERTKKPRLDVTDAAVTDGGAKAAKATKAAKALPAVIDLFSTAAAPSFLDTSACGPGLNTPLPPRARVPPHAVIPFRPS